MALNILMKLQLEIISFKMHSQIHVLKIVNSTYTNTIQNLLQKIISDNQTNFKFITTIQKFDLTCTFVLFISHNPECIDNSLVSITYIRYLAFFVFNISLLEEYLLGGKYVIVHYTSTYFARKRPNFYVVMANLKSLRILIY